MRAQGLVLLLLRLLRTTRETESAKLSPDVHTCLGLKDLERLGALGEVALGS